LPEETLDSGKALTRILKTQPRCPAAQASYAFFKLKAAQMSDHGPCGQAHCQIRNVPSKSALYKVPQPPLQDAVG